MFHQLQKQMMQQPLKQHNRMQIITHPAPSCQTQRFPTTFDSTRRTHSHTLLIHGQKMAQIPDYDHNKIYSYTYRNVA